MFVAVFGAAGFLNRLLHGFQNLFPVDAFVASDGFRHFDQFGTCLSRAHFHKFSHNSLLLL